MATIRRRLMALEAGSRSDAGVSARASKLLVELISASHQGTAGWVRVDTDEQTQYWRDAMRRIEETVPAGQSCARELIEAVISAPKGGHWVSPDRTMVTERPW